MTPRVGDCYEANARALTAPFFGLEGLGIPTDAELVHGTVTGEGRLAGVRFGHAWIEYEVDGRWIVRDLSNGTDTELPREAYYWLGDIDPEEVTRYSIPAAKKAVVTEGTWGPWEPHRLAHEEALERRLS